MTVKQERIAERIREILSTLLLTEVTDPALQGLTVTEVRLDKEIEYAEVYVNALGEENRRGQIMAGLKRANGFLRRGVGSALHTRRTPELRFHWDETLERGAHIESLIDALHQRPADEDAQHDSAR